MQKAIYQKPFKTVAEQIALLEGRGLSVDIDASDFAAFLRSVNYYRFTGYAIPFQIDREHFEKDAKASDILALYHYDRKLRDLLFEALEVIELNFRTIFAHEAARAHGPLGYLDAANFTDAAKHAKAVSRLQDEFDRSKEKCVLHFKANYANPPVWSVVEIASFGALVHFFRMMQPSDQNKIATAYGYQGNYTASYIQHLCVLRNLCAHHGRLYDHQWDYRFAALPEWKGLAVPKWRPFFYQCALVYRFLKPTEKFVFDRDGWKDRLCKLMGEIPQNPVFDAKARAAIPDDPAASPFWF